MRRKAIFGEFQLVAVMKDKVQGSASQDASRILVRGGDVLGAIRMCILTWHKSLYSPNSHSSCLPRSIVTTSLSSHHETDGTSFYFLLPVRVLAQSEDWDAFQESRFLVRDPSHSASWKWWSIFMGGAKHHLCIGWLPQVIVRHQFASLISCRRRVRSASRIGVYSPHSSLSFSDRRHARQHYILVREVRTDQRGMEKITWIKTIHSLMSMLLNKLSRVVGIINLL